MQSIDRRRDVRVHTTPLAEIVRIGASEPLQVLNASYRGLFVRVAGTPPAVNQLVKIRVELPSGPIELSGVPVRIVEDAQGRTGIGIRFFALNGDVKRMWEGYISSLLATCEVAA